MRASLYKEIALEPARGPLPVRGVTSGKLKMGDIVIFATVGVGFTVGVNLWRWAY